MCPLRMDTFFLAARHHARMTMEELRELLTNERMARGMSARALARELGVTPTTIGNWETGRREPKSWAEFQRRALFFGVDVALTTSIAEEDDLTKAVTRLRAADPDAVAAVAAYAMALAEADDRSRTLLVAQATAAMAFVAAAAPMKKTGTSE